MGKCSYPLMTTCSEIISNFFLSTPMFNIQKWSRSHPFFSASLLQDFSLSRHGIWRMRMAEWMRLWVSLSQLCPCARFCASCVRKSRNGLAPIKSMGPRPLPDYKDFGHYWWDFWETVRLTTFIDKAPFLPRVGAHKLHDLAWVLASKVESWEFFC